MLAPLKVICSESKMLSAVGLHFKGSNIKPSCTQKNRLDQPSFISNILENVIVCRRKTNLSKYFQNLKPVCLIEVCMNGLCHIDLKKKVKYSSIFYVSFNCKRLIKNDKWFLLHRLNLVKPGFFS